MKFIERFTLTLFADIMLIISIVACVLIFGWLDFNVAVNLFQKALTTEPASKIVLVCSILFILLSLNCIFFSSSDKQKKSSHGVLLENEKGKLLISEETLQNIANTVVTRFDGAEDVSTKISLDKDNNLLVYINIIVKPSTIIKELSANIQDKVKSTIKQVTDLDVKEVNIKVNNIAPKQNETDK